MRKPAWMENFIYFYYFMTKDANVIFNSWSSETLVIRT